MQLESWNRQPFRRVPVLEQIRDCCAGMVMSWELPVSELMMYEEASVPGNAGIVTHRIRVWMRLDVLKISISITCAGEQLLAVVVAMISGLSFFEA